MLLAPITHGKIVTWYIMRSIRVRRIQSQEKSVSIICVEIDDDLEDIVPGFLENRRNDIVKLLSFFEERNYDELERIGHKVSGSAGGYGFHGLGKIAKSIEVNAPMSNDDELGKLILEFKQYVENVEVKYIKVD